MKFKKIISYLMVCTMALSFAACTKNGNNAPGDDSVKINENNVTGGKKPLQGATNDNNNDDNKDNNNNSKNIAEFKLYFGDSQAEYLVPEQRQIENADAKKVLEELIKGPTSKEIYGVIDKSVKINGVTIKDKVANVDFDNSIEGKVTGSAGETLALYGMANTLILNSELGIEKVTFSVNNKPMDSLGGHIILDKPVVANEKIIKK